MAVLKKDAWWFYLETEFYIHILICYLDKSIQFFAQPQTVDADSKIWLI
jgi:hypothetical protein